MDNFRQFLLNNTITRELNRDEFNQVSTNKNRLDLTIDLYGKIIYGFKTANFFYFERLNSYYYIPLKEIKDNINMTICKDEEDKVSLTTFEVLNKYKMIPMDKTIEAINSDSNCLALLNVILEHGDIKTIELIKSWGLKVNK